MLELVTPRHVQFTAGDLIEGLAFMQPVQRRAVLFGMECKLPSPDRVSSLTHKGAMEMPLSILALAIIQAQPRHIRVPYVFWQELHDGVIAPVVGLDQEVRESFGGMGWLDLLRAYATMAWVDDELETEAFVMEARRAGLQVR